MQGKIKFQGMGIFFLVMPLAQTWLVGHEYMCYVYKITLRTCDISEMSRQGRPVTWPLIPLSGISSFCNTTKVQSIIGIVEGLRLRSWKRLTVNVIRNQPAISLAGQQRNRITLDETNIASAQIMEYDLSPVVGLRRSFSSLRVRPPASISVET